MCSDKNKSLSVLIEVTAILALTLVAQFLQRTPRTILTFLPLVYVVAELYARGRSWADVGFRPQAVRQDVVANWIPILLVAVVIQFAVVYLARMWMPAFLDHVVARFPFPIDQAVKRLSMLLAGTLVGALLEEVAFRGLFQERLSWFIPAPLAIGVVSLTFGVGHWASGEPLTIFD